MGSTWLHDSASEDVDTQNPFTSDALIPDPVCNPGFIKIILVPGCKSAELTIHDIDKTAGFIEHEFPFRLAPPLGKDIKAAGSAVGPTKKLEGRRTTMDDPIARLLLVVKATVTIPTVVLWA